MNKEEKSEQSRKHIIDAAVKEFGNKGYLGASTNAISSENQISKGLLFYHFKTKEQLFCACAKQGIDELDAYLAAHIKGYEDPMRAIRECCELRRIFFTKQPAYQTILFEVLFGSLHFENALETEISLRYRNHIYGIVIQILQNVDIKSTLNKMDVLNIILRIMEYIDYGIWKEYELNRDVEHIVEEHMKRYEICLEIMFYGLVERK